jgi:ribosome-binding ATPase YchF (GTP1/OBG family)
MSLKCGIVGLPNVGKSTLFNALTKAGIAAENYPFCTIEPNVGVVEVPDPRLDAAGRDRQARAHGAGHRRVRRHRRPGGRRQQGRRPGQPVPGHIRETDAIVNVVRCFEDENVIHVAGKVDPIADIEVIQTELCLADLGTVEKACTATPRPPRRATRKPPSLVEVLEKCQAALNEGKPVRSSTSARKSWCVLKPLCLITAKPAMFVGNVAETASRTTPASTACGVRREAERARGGHLRQDRGRMADMATRTRPCSWPRWARTSPA